MKELFDQLDEREKNWVRLLSLLVLLVLVFLLLISLGQRRSYVRLLSRLEQREKVLAELETKRASSAAEWARWEDAYRDIEELRKSYFYKAEEGINQLRLDLQKIFAQSGISAQSIRYDYASLEEGKVKKTNASFTFTGSYLILKKFLEVVEQFPRFLMLEKIDFLKISGEGSVLELKINLAGYHESF
jgi:Tfp pilus assembly protein PilO